MHPNGTDKEFFLKSLRLRGTTQGAAKDSKNGADQPADPRSGPKGKEEKPLDKVFEDLSRDEQEALHKIVREILPKD